MTAQTLDGAATLRTIKAELAQRVPALRERGVVPGVGPMTRAMLLSNIVEIAEKSLGS